jgi:glycosyltransferase involved in cell wall biosynthesis
MKINYSVAMATYNGEKYIAEMIESILSQTISVTEIVISDDMSTDRTLEIIQRVTNNQNVTIKVLVNRQRMGFAKNFENALRHCTEEWIFLADQDDKWPQNKVEVCDFTAKNTEKDLVIHDCIICDEGLQPIFGSSLNRYRELTISTSDRNIGCCMLVRRRLLEACLPFPIHVSHDIFLGLVANKTFGREVIEEPLLYHRRHDNAASCYLPDSTNEITPLRKVFFRLRINLGENRVLLAIRSPKKFLQLLHLDREITRCAQLVTKS